MRYYMLNKPMGKITACSDPRHATVMDCFSVGERQGLFPVGRLDKDTVGLLLLTDDGKWAQRVINGKSGISKTYMFYVTGDVTDEKLKILRGEMTVGGGREFTTCGAAVEMLEEATLLEISEYLPGEAYERLAFTRRGKIKATRGIITIAEGKKHQVKRMLKAVGLTVVYLKRISVGSLFLDENLKEGEYRPLTENEILLAETK